MGLRECVETCLNSSGGAPPPQPSPYVNSLLSVSIAFVHLSSPITQWMESVGLDPDDRADALLALSMVARNAEGVSPGGGQLGLG